MVGASFTPTPKCPSGEMVDALLSGGSGRKAVQVRVLSWAQQRYKNKYFFIHFALICLEKIILSILCHKKINYTISFYHG